MQRKTRYGAGRVTAVSGSDVLPGDRVVWGVTVSCGTCDRCRSGLTAKCRMVPKMGHEPFEPAWPLSGGYAGHVPLPRGSAIARVPIKVPDAVAAPAACATATVMAVLDRAGSVARRRVLVGGAGMLGITATAAVADRGAPEVVVVDIGGTLVLAGAASPAAAVRLEPERVVRRWLSVHGVHSYEPRHLEEALAFLVETQQVRAWDDPVEPPVPPRPAQHVAGRSGGPVPSAPGGAALTVAT